MPCVSSTISCVIPHRVNHDEYRDRHKAKIGERGLSNTHQARSNFDVLKKNRCKIYERIYRLDCSISECHDYRRIQVTCCRADHEPNITKKQNTSKVTHENSSQINKY